MKNLKNYAVWIVIGLTVLTVLIHISTIFNDTYYFRNAHLYMWVSIFIYIAGALIAFRDCRVGLILYAVGITIDIVSPVISKALDIYAIPVYVVSAVIALILLIVGIRIQKAQINNSNIELINEVDNQDENMFCKYCGNKVRGKDSFCKRCGAALR